ncbi:unnamed protein product [Mytilus edulis]|uniref:PHR domain-containing protein n=1 Tax=Mytilus edulis TaxID=6550 RepID=A0A8S3UDN0_MYTED|nr:unnamed protein product [Mytilus edulis]
MAREFQVLRHTNVDGPWHLDGDNTDALTITVDTNIALTAVILYGLINDIPDLADRGNTIRVHYGNERYEQTYVISANGQQTQTVSIINPIPIIANTGFTVVVDTPTFYVHYGTQCQAICTTDDIVITFERSPLCTTDTDEEQGQIAGIEFNA